MYIDKNRGVVGKVYTINRGDPLELYPKASIFVIRIEETLEHFDKRSPDDDIINDVVEEYEDSLQKTNGEIDHRVLFERALNKLCKNNIYDWQWVAKDPMMVWLD